MIIVLTITSLTCNMFFVDPSDSLDASAGNTKTFKDENLNNSCSTEGSDGYDSDRTVLLESACNSTLIDHTYTKTVCADSSSEKSPSQETTISKILGVLYHNHLEHDYFDKRGIEGNNEIDECVSPYSVATQSISSDKPEEPSERINENDNSVIDKQTEQENVLQGVDRLEHCDENVTLTTNVKNGNDNKEEVDLHIKDNQNNNDNREEFKKINAEDKNDRSDTDESDVALIVSDVESFCGNDKNEATDCESSTSFTFNFKELGNF